LHTFLPAYFSWLTLVKTAAWSKSHMSSWQLDHWRIWCEAWKMTVLLFWYPTGQTTTLISTICRKGIFFAFDFETKDGYLDLKVHKIWFSGYEFNWFLRYLLDVCEFESEVRQSISRINYDYILFALTFGCYELYIIVCYELHYTIYTIHLQVYHMVQGSVDYTIMRYTIWGTMQFLSCCSVTHNYIIDPLVAVTTLLR
jgi:hypothetical protein